MLNNVDEIELSNQIAQRPTKVPLASTPGNPFLPATLLADGDSLEWQPSADQVVSSAGESLNDLNIRASKKELKKNPQNPYLLANVGLSLLNSGKAQEALEYFENAVRIDPSFVAAKLNLAHAHFALGELDSALSIYRGLEGSYSNKDMIHTNIAEILLRVSLKDKGTMRQHLEQARDHLLAVSHRSAAGENTLGLIYSLMGNGRNAIVHFRRALAENPTLSASHLNVAAWYLRSKNYRKALTHYRAGFSLDPTNRLAIKNIARCLLELGMADRAEEFLREHKNSSFNDDVEYLTILARAAHFSHRYKTSIVYLHQALDAKYRTSDDDALIYNNIGCAYDGLGEHAKAEEYFIKAINVTRSQPEPFINIAYQRIAANAIAEASAMIRHLEEAFPNDGRLAYLKSRYYLHMESYDESLKYALLALGDEESVDAEVYGTASYLYFEIFGDYAKAVELVKAGLKHSPSNPGLVNNLAYYYIMKGDLERGRQVLNRTSAVDSEHTPFLDATRGLLSIKEGRLKEGERLYNLAISKTAKSEIQAQLRQKCNLELGRYWLEQSKPQLAERYLRVAATIQSLYKLYSKQAADLLCKN